MAATTPVYGSTGNAYLTYPSLTAFTTLAEAFSNKKNRETMELLITKMEAMKTSVDSLINNTNAKELKDAMDNLKNTIVSMGSSINSDAPTWEDIIDAIKRIPVENFTIPKDAEKKTYTLPEAYISWGDNLAYAYDVAKQFQDTIDLRGIIGEKGTYKGFYMIELSLDALTYVAGSNYYTLQVIRENSNGHFADAYMINGNRNSETNLIEWDPLSDYGTNEVKTFKIDLDDLPDNGKLFLFGLHFADEWDATILNNDQVKDRGKALILGGHPKRVITLSGCRYDEGIIQLNRTGEMVDHNLPDAVQSIREASLDTPYICVEDQQSEEKSLTFTGTVVKTDGTEVKNVTKTFLADGGIEQRSGSHYWYIVFDSDVASFKDFIIQDRYHTVRESRYETDASTGARVEIPYETGEGDYQWILDNDGYDIDLSTEYDHPGTTYSFASPITNDIYLRQARVPSSGSLNISSSGYIDKIHMPEYVAHTSGTIANSDSDLYELELPALKSNAGTIASSCGKLHELTLPSLETNSGTIASNDGNLYKLSLPNLKTSTGTIASGCSKLSVLELPELEYGTNSSLLINCGGETIVYLPKLRYCGGKDVHWFNNNGAIYLDLPSYDGSFTHYDVGICSNMPNILWVNIPYGNANEQMDNGGVVFYNCPKLQRINIPSVTGFYGMNNVYGAFNSCAKLRIVIMGRIVGWSFRMSPDYSVCFKNCNSLIHLEIGVGTTLSWNICGWDPTDALDSSKSDLIENMLICSDNLEQFLYNFRTYIIDRLYDYTSGTKHTITLHSSVYNKVLGLDEEGYANTFYMPDESIDYVTSLNQKLSSINWGLAY